MKTTFFYTGLNFYTTGMISAGTEDLLTSVRMSCHVSRESCLHVEAAEFSKAQLNAWNNSSNPDALRRCAAGATQREERKTFKQAFPPERYALL